MPKFAQRTFVSFCILCLLLSSFPFPIPAEASGVSCSVTTSPNQVASGSTNNFPISITNTSSLNIVWIHIVRPSVNFTLGSVLASGWSGNQTTTETTLNGGTISSGNNKVVIERTVQAANVNAPAANWTVEVSSDSGGASPVACSGNLAVQIGTVTAPSIGNIVVSAITSNSANISWVSNVAATSRVDFGTSASYGQSEVDSSLTTIHTMNLASLSAGTTYHFQVSSTDANNLTASSGDNTFVTQSLPPLPPPPPPPPKSSSGDSSPTPAPAVDNPTVVDSTAPVVLIQTDLAKIFKSPPLIVGTATDNDRIISVDYSLDGGLNWIQADSTSGLNTKEAKYSFQPAQLPDDNYEILVRAADPSGNIGFSVKKTLVIDQLPPRLGQDLISFGPQIAPSKNSVSFAVQGLDQKITLAAVGGPVSVVIKALSEKTAETQLFTLTKDRDSGLWSGTLGFTYSGVYRLASESIDGAKNNTKQELGSVAVQSPSKIVDKQGKGIRNAVATLYYYDTETETWVVWDGKAYNQDNPVKTDSEGQFGLFVPSGKYYLAVSAKGFSEEKSEIFSFQKPTPLSVSIKLKKTLGISLGPLHLGLPELSFNSFKIQTNLLYTKPEGNQLDLLDKELASFSLESTQQKEIRNSDFKGKPTVLCFITTWAPNSADQLRQLSLLSGGSYNVLVVVSLENLDRIRSYQLIGGYKSLFLSDANAFLSSELNAQLTPTSVFLDKTGKIKGVESGLLSKEELQTKLAKL